MNLGFRDDNQDAEIIQDDFATLAGSIVSESEKLMTLGDEVAEACTEETLKKVYYYDNDQIKLIKSYSLHEKP